MPSIKLGQLAGLASMFLGSGRANTQVPKANARDLLQKNPLEVNFDREPSANVKKDPLAFASLQFPSDLGEQSGSGHFLIFYSISTNHSKVNDSVFNASIGAREYTGGAASGNYNQKRLKTRSGFSEGTVKIGQSTRNSTTSKISTHNTVTGGVALYMPPGIKVEYSVNNGPTELGISGLAVKEVANVVGAESTQNAIEAFLEGAGNFSFEAAKRAGVAFGEAVGLGDITAAVSKVTGTAVNPFSEVVFEKVNHRNFNYTFNLTARNKKEAKDIDNIVKFFKYHMHPELDMSGIGGGRYFRVPSEFEIFYAYKDQLNEYLNKISRCVLTNVSIDYGGEQFSTFRQFDGQGAAPVGLTMTLAFTETEIMTKETIMAGM